MQYLKGINIPIKNVNVKGKSKSVQISRTVKSFEPRSYFISIVGNYDLPGTYFQVYAPSKQSYSTCLKKNLVTTLMKQRI